MRSLLQLGEKLLTAGEQSRKQLKGPDLAGTSFRPVFSEHPVHPKFFEPSEGLQYLTSHSLEVSAGQLFERQSRTAWKTKTSNLIR